MATQQGTVSRVFPDKRFGFVKTSTGDVHFGFNVWPQGSTPAQGDSVEIETKSTSKGNTATKIIILSKTATPATTGAAPSSGGKTPEVVWSFGTARTEDHLFELVVQLEVKLGGKPLPGVTVELYENKSLIDLPTSIQTTSGDCKVQFFVRYANDATDPAIKIDNLTLNAVVTVSGKEYSFGQLWPPQLVVAVQAPTPAPPPTPAATPQPTPEPDKLEATVAAFPNAAGLFSVTVTTLAGDRKVKGRFTVSSANVLTVSAIDGTSLGTGASISLETASDGTLEFFVGYASAGQASVTFKLPKGNNPVKKNLTKAKLERKVT
jgi:cold shock CspA family protein